MRGLLGEDGAPKTAEDVPTDEKKVEDAKGRENPEDPKSEGLESGHLHGS